MQTRLPVHLPPPARKVPRKKQYLLGIMRQVLGRPHTWSCITPAEDHAWADPHEHVNIMCCGVYPLKLVNAFAWH